MSGLGDSPGPLDGLLIPSALLSLCILLFRINLIQSDNNLLSRLLGSQGILQLALSPIRTVPEESDRLPFILLCMQATHSNSRGNVRKSLSTIPSFNYKKIAVEILSKTPAYALNRISV